MDHLEIKVKVEAKTEKEAQLMKMLIHIYNVTGSMYLRRYIKEGLEKAFHRLLCEKDIFTIEVIKVYEGEKDGN